MPGRNREEMMDDILEDPRYFECEKNHAKIKLLHCIGRQRANQEFSGFGHRPYEECLSCSQGDSNTKFESLLVNDPKPQRGMGSRNLACSLYDDCLGLVSEKDWKSWNCEKCPVYREGNEAMEVVAEEKGPARICEECQQKETITPKSPLCASCLAKRSGGNRKSNRKARQGIAMKRKGRGEGKGSGRGEIVAPGGDLKLAIDFSGHPAVIQAVREMAEAEIRPVDLQVIYMLKTQLEGRKAL